MSPPKSSKARLATVPPLDFSRKLRIIRSPKCLGAFLTSEGHSDVRAPTEYQQLSRRFASQFPSLASAARRTGVSLAKSQDAIGEKSVSLERPNIRVPEWSLITKKANSTIGETVIGASGTKPKVEIQIDDVSLNAGRFLLNPRQYQLTKDPQKVQQVKQAKEEGDQAQLNDKSPVSSELKASNLASFSSSELDACPQGQYHIEAPIELPVETVADLLMEYAAQCTKTLPPRVNYERSATYIRYSLSKAVSPSTKAFGKDGIYYQPRLEDYVFLITLNLQLSQNRGVPISWATLKWLLTQLLQKRNLPFIGQELEPEMPTRKEIASLYDEEAEIVNLIPGRWSVTDGQIKSETTPRAETNGTLGEDRRVSYSPILPSLSEQAHIKEDTLPDALSNMNYIEFRYYKRMAGPYVTDEIFVYLINLFEMITGEKECASTEAAITESKLRLGPLTPQPRVLRKIYNHWRARRLEFGKPLLREFWLVPSASDNSPSAVFRARTKEKMVLRRPRRSAQDAGTRFSRLSEEFIKTETLFEATRLRDWLKLQICDVDAILFEQMWKERFDIEYKNPGWPTLKNNIENLLINTNTTGGLTSAAVTIHANNMELRERLVVPTNIEGFGLDCVDRDEGPYSGRHAKRQRLDCPVKDLKDFNGSSAPLYHLNCINESQPQVINSNASRSSRKTIDLLTKERKSSQKSENVHPSGRNCSSINATQTARPSNVENTTNQITSPLRESSMHLTNGPGLFRLESHSTEETDVTTFRKNQPTSHVYQSPIPLPPIFLQLDINCSEDHLMQELERNGVRRKEPEGYVDRSPAAVSYELLQRRRSHLNFGVDTPLPSAVEIKASPLSLLPIPQRKVLLRKDGQRSTSVIEASQQRDVYSPSQSHLQPLADSYNVPPDLFAPSSASESAVGNFDSANSAFTSAIPDRKESVQPQPYCDLKFSPVFRQSLESLPPAVRHESNIRYIIPFGPPFAGQQAYLSNDKQTQHEVKTSPSSLLGPPMRGYLRSGRNSRLWFDRHQVIIPTCSLLTPTSVSLSPDLDRSQFPLSQNPFCWSLQTHARRLVGLINGQVCQYSFSNDQTSISMKCGLPNPIIQQLRKYRDCHRINQLMSRKDQSTCLVAANNSREPNAQVHLLLQQTTLPQPPPLLHQSRLNNYSEINTCNRSTPLPSQSVKAPQCYTTCCSPNGLTLRRVSTDLEMKARCGYSDSGFYPNGVGGPESAIGSLPKMDFEPGFASVFGMDAKSNAGDFGLFCAPRNMFRRNELWDDLLAKAPA